MTSEERTKFEEQARAGFETALAQALAADYAYIEFERDIARVGNGLVWKHLPTGNEAFLLAWSTPIIDLKMIYPETLLR